MRIREKKTQTYDRFRYLLEFQVKRQPELKEQDETPSEDELGGDVFGELGDALDGNKKPEEQGAEQTQTQEPIENKPTIDVDTSDNQTFDDTVSDLLKVHSSKIDNLTQFINDSVKILQVLNQKTDEMTTNVDQMNGKVGELSQRVDKLTPPTPLESLNQMISTTTGAQSIENYWNEYFAKHGRTDMVNGSLYYGDKQYNQNEKGMTSGVYKTPEISDNQIKDIIRNS
jgi:hypothetical protein